MPAVFIALRVVLTGFFLFFGLQKLLGAEPAIALYNDLGFGQWPRFVTGTVEVLGALALWTPAAGVAGFFLIAAMAVGFVAKLAFVGPPVWHLAALLVATTALMIGHSANRKRADR
ncbi:hypothetical protein E2L08_04255 [Palleronia sediminis]|uniref:DoxX family protein n=1 Tax=Palleronia sediminis TaxID=2547833 RepID=A0A4R6AFJ8_9RHOB|nr:DoxX family protein [Palleronia sediminis]TDL81872.1 hypothetical protein E2L08_04255 [Palleronia sediminis]